MWKKHSNKRKEKGMSHMTDVAIIYGGVKAESRLNVLTDYASIIWSRRNSPIPSFQCLNCRPKT